MQSLKIKNLTKHFGGVYAVNGVSMEFAPGAITALIGPNGSGKSTLINTLTGIYPMDGGTVEVNDKKLHRVGSHQAASLGLTRTFQEVRLFEQMSVEDNVLVVMTKRGVVSALREASAKKYLGRVEQTLKKVGLWEKRSALANQLSYGQRKLLEIARVLVMDSPVIFLDEPFAGLFPEMVKQVTDIVQELKRQGKAIILVEHNMELIRKIADRIVVLDSGEILAEGEPEQVLSQPKVIEAYLGK